MKKQFLFQIIFVAISILVISSCGKKNEQTNPIVGEITESVYAAGKIKAQDQYNAFSTVNGILQKVYVKVGDSITIGTPLFILDNVTSELNSQNALLALQLSEENNKTGSDKLKELELAVTIAKDKYLLDSTIYARQKKLWEQNVGSQIELEQKKLIAASSKSTYQSAELKLNQIKTQLLKELKNAGLNYSITQKMAGDYTIKSNINGKVYDILKEPGELITTQTMLAVLGSSKDFYIEMEVDENDIAGIKLGQEVVITMDSYKGKVFKAKVSEIYPIMNERSHTFTIKAKFTEKPSTLYPNLSLEANIIINTKKNAITIPREYLFTGDSVMIDDEVKKAVKIGLKDYKKVEILEGLSVEETIYKIR